MLRNRQRKLPVGHECDGRPRGTAAPFIDGLDCAVGGRSFNSQDLSRSNPGNSAKGHPGRRPLWVARDSHRLVAAGLNEDPAEILLIALGPPTYRHIPKLYLLHRRRGTRHMSYERESPRDFGVDDGPFCPNCKRRMSLTRRSPDADHGLDHERQFFSCRTCDHWIERVVDVAGNPPAKTRVQPGEGSNALLPLGHVHSDAKSATVTKRRS